MLRSRGRYLIYQISQDNIRRDAGTEYHAVEDVNPYNSYEDIEKPKEYQEKYDATNTRRADIREGATRDSWKKTPKHALNRRQPILSS